MSDASTRSPRYGVLVATIAAALPITAAVHGLIARSTQLEVAQVAREGQRALSEREQEAALRRQLVERALDPRRGASERVEVLRFLRAVSTDELFTAWAEAELSSLMAIEEAEAHPAELSAEPAQAAAPASPDVSADSPKTK